MSDIDTNNIVLNLKSNTKEEVINELTTRLFENNNINSKEEFIETVLNREKEFSTSIGRGVAIPHGKSDSVIKSGFAFAKLYKPIHWNKGDENSVELVFLLAVDNEGAKNKHLEMLATLSQKLMDDDFIEKLKNSDNKEEISILLGGE